MLPHTVPGLKVPDLETTVLAGGHGQSWWLSGLLTKTGENQNDKIGRGVEWSGALKVPDSDQLSYALKTQLKAPRGISCLLMFLYRIRASIIDNF